MRELESYSIEELEELTGYDRRTVSYYISEGLLPKVGRRGRNTRYGREFVDRLKFITRAKDLQDSGKLPSVTLADMATLIDTLEPEDIAEAGKSNRKLQELFAQALDENQDEGLDESPDEPSYTRLGEPASGECAPAAPKPSASYSLDVFADQSKSIESTVMSAEASYDSRELDEMREAMHQQMHDFQRHMMKEAEAAQYELRELIQGVRQMREELGSELKQLRQVREELAEMRRGMPRRSSMSELRQRARQWAKEQGFATHSLKVARLRPDGNSWQFPVDRKMPMLRGEFDLLCEGRPGTGDGEFIALRVPYGALREQASYFFKLAKSPTIPALVTCDQTSAATRQQDSLQLCMNDFLLHADTGK